MTIGQVEWDVAAGADYYTVNGETSQGLTVSCNTSDTSCALHNLNCGQTYNITVTAHNRVFEYVSVSTESAIIMTGEEKSLFCIHFFFNVKLVHCFFEGNLCSYVL